MLTLLSCLPRLALGSEQILLILPSKTGRVKSKIEAKEKAPAEWVSSLILKRQKLRDWVPIRNLKKWCECWNKIANFSKGKKWAGFDTETRGLDFLGGREIKKTRYMWVELSMYIFNYGTSIILSTALSKER